MKKKIIQYVIGVDGGGTKTIAALANFKGKILVKSKSGPSSPRNIGIKRAILNITEAIIPLLKKKKIISTVIALPAIEEEYRVKKREILKFLKAQKKISQIFQGKVKIVSDQITAFRAGTNEKEGVLLIAGTGCVAHGWRKGEEAKASGWGWLADEGSAFWLGQRVFQKILRDLDRRGPKTLLTKLAFQKFKVKDIPNFLKKIYSPRTKTPEDPPPRFGGGPTGQANSVWDRQKPTEIIPQLSIICDKASQKGDKVAKEVIVEAGKEIASAAKTVIYQLNFQKIKFPLILVGSMFKSKIVLDIVQKEIKKIAPRVQVIQSEEPLRGAIKLALELLENESNKN